MSVLTEEQLGTDYLLTPQMLAATGITRRQLDYWSREGHLQTFGDPRPGSGISRMFRLSEVVIARRMRALTSAGVVPGEAARIARGGQFAPGVRVVFDDDQLAGEPS